MASAKKQEQAPEEAPAVEEAPKPKPKRNLTRERLALKMGKDAAARMVRE